MSERSPHPVNAFSPEYLAVLREQDEPASATDGDVVGPWRLREHEDKFHLFREWERFETGHRPVASFNHREDALLFVVALGVAGRSAIFRPQEPASGQGGFQVDREGEVVGTVWMHRADLLVIAHTLASVARSPVDLSILLELAGTQVQEMTGEILGMGVLGDAGGTQGS